MEPIGVYLLVSSVCMSVLSEGAVKPMDNTNSQQGTIHLTKQFDDKSLLVGDQDHGLNAMDVGQNELNGDEPNGLQDIDSSHADHKTDISGSNREQDLVENSFLRNSRDRPYFNPTGWRLRTKRSSYPMYAQRENLKIWRLLNKNSKASSRHGMDTLKRAEEELKDNDYFVSLWI